VYSCRVLQITGFGRKLQLDQTTFVEAGVAPCGHYTKPNTVPVDSELFMRVEIETLLNSILNGEPIPFLAHVTFY
jgi:hypothetical protein